MGQANESSLKSFRDFMERHKKEIMEDYYTFLSFPSVSSEPQYQQDVLGCADWLAQFLKDLDFTVEYWISSHHPVIFATHCKAGPHKPTLLIYNHYDVQPVDPLEEWLSPPFQPTIKNGDVYARGAQDNKGQCMYVLQAIKLYLKLHGSLPLNIKLCIEGEEEMGSAGLSQLLKTKKEELQADYLAIVDLGLRDPKVPAVTLGIRGLVTMDVEVIGSKVDLHSGSHGGIVPNPIHALIQLLASLRDEKGKITVPGFYDKIIEMPLEERGKVSFNFNVDEYQKTTGAYPAGGEKAFTALERAWIRPTLEINGIHGGYTGKGFKTVIPAKASAKISCRLVPNQDPQHIGELVANYLKNNPPLGVEVKVNVHPGGGKAVRANATAKIVEAFSRAFSEVFDMPCEFIFEGASIPIVTELSETCGGEVILIGLGLTTDQIHAPNEHFSVKRIEKGILIMGRAFELLAGN